jgi:hypothetical protein
VPVDLAGSDVLLNGQQFDVLVVDGLDRYQCAIRSLTHLKPGGAVLLDDSNGYWGPREGQYPILELFRIHGFQRIDFFGYAPGVILPRGTSLFFKEGTFLLSGAENVRGHIEP